MNKKADPRFCMSSWLMFRTIVDPTKCFMDGLEGFHLNPPLNRVPIYNSTELLEALQNQVLTISAGKPVALALSGGIDSAILAKMVPRGSVAYTFKCVVGGSTKTISNLICVRAQHTYDETTGENVISLQFKQSS